MLRLLALVLGVLLAGPSAAQGRIHGHLFDEAGRLLVEGWHVTLHSPTSPTYKEPVSIRPDRQTGEFEFPYSRDGSFYLSARSGDGQAISPIVLNLKGQRDRYRALVASERDPRRTVRVIFRLPSGARMGPSQREVRLVDKDGNSYAPDFDSDMRESRYIFTDTGPGPFTLQLRGQRFHHRDFPGIRPGYLNKLTLANHAELVFTVLDPRGEPHPVVDVLRAEFSPTNTLKLEPAVHYRDPSTNQLTIEAPMGSAFYVLQPQGAPEDAIVFVQDLDPSETRRVVVPWPERSGPHSVLLCTPDGAPLPSHTVEARVPWYWERVRKALSHATVLPQERTSDAEGRLTLPPVLPGAVRLLCSIGPLIRIDQEFDLSAGPGEELRLLAPETFALEGKLLLPEGASPKRTQLVLTPESTEVPRVPGANLKPRKVLLVKIDEDGGFVIPDLPAGALGIGVYDRRRRSGPDRNGLYFTSVELGSDQPNTVTLDARTP